jgi:hypothetical protein
MAIPNPKPSESAGGGGIEQDLLDALRAELAEERARKDSLEKRGLAVAAGATTSLALVLGLGSRYSGAGQQVFFTVMILGALAFLASAFWGWRTSKSMEYSEISLKEFERILEHGWTEGSADDFRLFLADGVLETIAGARSNNNEKEEAFRWSLTALFAGAAFVVVQIAFVFVDRVFA